LTQSLSSKEWVAIEKPVMSAEHTSLRDPFHNRALKHGDSVYMYGANPADENMLARLKGGLRWWKVDVLQRTCGEAAFDSEHGYDQELLEAIYSKMQCSALSQFLISFRDVFKIFFVGEGKEAMWKNMLSGQFCTGFCKAEDGFCTKDCAKGEKPMTMQDIDAAVGAGAYAPKYYPLESGIGISVEVIREFAKLMGLL
jgi:hypothetical protein